MIMKLMQSGRQTARRLDVHVRQQLTDHLSLDVLVIFSGV